MSRAAAGLVAALLVTPASSARADGEGRTPGRFASLSIGAVANPSLGHATRKPPALLAVAPTLELTWGIQLGDEWLVTTRLDALGAIIPIGPAGYGLDLGVAWAPSLAGRGWGPIVRFTGGGLFYASGGESFGPDYQAGGFRMGLDVGIIHSERVNRIIFVWGVVAGAHASGMTSISPCNPGDDCSDAFIGPTVRLEAGLLF